MKSKTKRLSLVLRVAAALSFSAVCADGSCGLNWTVPSNHFNGVNERGVVSYWEEIDSVDVGEGLRFPLIINFRSDRSTSSAYLGNGWLLSLLESSIYQINERNFVMAQPDGPNRYFYRTKPQETVLKDRGGWAAEIKGDTITAWAECGWKLAFKNGRLVSMQTPENRKLDFVQVAGGVVELREGGKVHLKAATDPSTGHITGLEFNNRRVGIDLEDRPIVRNINGQNLVASMAPSLHRLTGVPGGPKEYYFSVDKKLQPNLRIAGTPERLLVWNPTTKLIAADTGWSYFITPGKDVFANAAIERKNAQGGKESWHYDRARGIETEQSLDGLKRVTTYLTSGLLAGKLRRVEEIAGGKSRLLRDLSYDEKGQLARETDANGVVTAFKYDDQSQLAEIIRDGLPFARRSYDDKNRVTAQEVIDVEKVSFRYLPAGGYEKSVVKTSGEIETLVYNKAEKLVEGVFGGGEKVVFAGEFTPTIIPGNTEKRDILIKELAANLAQLKNPIARGELLIRIGAIYSDDALGPSDPNSAIKVFESILIDPTMDDYMKAQAHSWIASKYIEIGRSEWPKGVKQMERLLAMKGDGLPPERMKGLVAEQREGFRKLLALTETGQSKKDEEFWRAMLIKYGSSDDFNKQLNERLAEQKQILSTQYFNN